MDNLVRDIISKYDKAATEETRLKRKIAEIQKEKEEISKEIFESMAFTPNSLLYVISKVLYEKTGKTYYPKYYDNTYYLVNTTYTTSNYCGVSYHAIRACEINEEDYDRKCLTYYFVWMSQIYRDEFGRDNIPEVPKGIYNQYIDFEDYIEKFIIYLTNKQLAKEDKCLTEAEMYAAVYEFTNSKKNKTKGLNKKN